MLDLQSGQFTFSDKPYHSVVNPDMVHGFDLKAGQVP